MLADQAVAPPLIRWLRLPLAIVCGAIMALGLAPYDLWYLGLAGLIAAFWLFASAPKGLYAVGTGWGVGLGYFGVSLGWIVEPFMVDAAVTGWMAPFALFGMAGGLALFWGLAFWGAAHQSRYPLAALVFLWAAAEFARAYVFTGFPWALLGYIWTSVSPIQLASVIGPHGMTLVTLIFAACAMAGLRTRRPNTRPSIAAITLLAALFLGGTWLTPPLQDLSDRPSVRLIQPNAPQHEKWDPRFVKMFFDRQLSLSEAAPEPNQRKPDLIVWPETAVPVMLERSEDARRLMTLSAQGAHLVAGIQRGSAGTYFNSLILLDGTGALAQIYDKHHLVPFGEYMPAAAIFRRWNIAGLAARADGGYTPGPGPELLELGALGRALPLICYEAVFPQDVYRSPSRPDFLLQITNDAWFGKWSGPYQHLAQARVRAIEQGLPMLRSANTGVSAVIDGAGRILADLDLGVAGKVDSPLPPPLRVTLYSRFGDFPIFLLLVLGCLCLFWTGRRVSD